ncbi:MAG: GTPase [Myxococcota bacterium]
MPIDAALRSAVEAGRGLVDVGPLTGVARTLDRPWRLAVIGRTGSGKTTLIGRRTGARRPTGLGGVTREVDEIVHDGIVWADTPGIDDPDSAVVALSQVLDHVDAAVWVVDGLQPMTASERGVVAATLPDGVPLWVVVSRIDLVDPDEHDAIVGRVRELAARHAPIAVSACDLRREDPGPVGILPLPGPRRRAAIAAAVDAVRSSLAAVPVPVEPEQVERQWRDGVRDVVRAVQRAIESGPAATAVLVERGARLVRALADDDGPRLPLPVAPERSAVESALSGPSGALRAVRASAARWLADGEWVIHDGWPGAGPRRARADRRRAVVEALDAVDAIVRPGSVDG